MHFFCLFGVFFGKKISKTAFCWGKITPILRETQPAGNRLGQNLAFWGLLINQGVRRLRCRFFIFSF